MINNDPQMLLVKQDQTSPPGYTRTVSAVGAIANAIYQATGLRLRRMPLAADAIRRAAMQ